MINCEVIWESFYKGWGKFFFFFFFQASIPPASVCKEWVFSISNLVSFRIGFSASWFLCWMRDEQKKSAAAACRVLCSNCSGSQGQRRIVLVNGWNYFFFCHLSVGRASCSFFFSLRNPPHNSSFLYFHLCHLLQTLYRNCVLHETETMWPLECVFVFCFRLLCSHPVIPCWAWNKPELWKLNRSSCTCT